MTAISDSAPRRRHPFVGVVLMIIGAIVLTAFASVAPAAMRKLVLFAVGFGLLIGSVVAWTAREYGVSRRVALLVSTILVPIGLTFSAVRFHGQLVAAQEAANRQNPDRLAGLNMLEQAVAADPQVADLLERRRRELHPGFADYLATRVTSLGEWQDPWPVIFWAGELMLAVVAGGFVVVRSTRERLAATNDDSSTDPGTV